MEYIVTRSRYCIYQEIVCLTGIKVKLSPQSKGALQHLSLAEFGEFLPNPPLRGHIGKFACKKWRDPLLLKYRVSQLEV